MSLDWPDLPSTLLYAIRSQRDLQLNVSIDQIIYPTVHMNNVLLEPLNYTWDAFSNLATMAKWGVSRFVLNLYWNANVQGWQLCPFLASGSAGGAAAAAAAAAAATAEEAAQFTYKDRAYTCNMTISVSTFLQQIVKEQYIVETDDNLSARTIIITLSLLNAIVPDSYASSPDSSKMKIIYSASLSSSNTSEEVPATTVEAVSEISTLFARGATTSTSTTSTSTSTSTSAIAAAAAMATTNIGLGKHIYRDLGTYMFTPPGLESARAREDVTWNSTGASKEGWPLVNYVLFEEFYRVLFSFGEIEVEESVYDTSQDADYIFSTTDIPYENDSQLTYDTAFTSSELKSTAYPVCSITSDFLVEEKSSGKSFAPSFLLAFDTTDNVFSASAIQKYIECGFSPVFNATLDTAAEIVTYLKSNLLSAIWSWELNEPVVATTTSSSAEVVTTSASCAILTGAGWAAENCYAKHRVACRVSKAAYSWAIPSKEANYYYDEMCSGSNQLFSLPRTPLQNTYLQQLRLSTVGDEAIWIDLNSIATPNCWVTGGPSATCTYYDSKEESILYVVPIVAAVIVATLLSRQYPQFLP
ncbi:uncharacterized protein V1518DRAFT_412356 [Limtongia smithiae]|uniref:uncharacterized protein n=1 Tax=Limtongia smithiae TaxID=1125753 RepID=UPI0034CF6CA8